MLYIFCKYVDNYFKWSSNSLPFSISLLYNSSKILTDKRNAKPSIYPQIKNLIMGVGLIKGSLLCIELKIISLILTLSSFVKTVKV